MRGLLQAEAIMSPIVPMEISIDLNATHPEITRAAIVFHGKGRNVEGYSSALQRAARVAAAQ